MKESVPLLVIAEVLAGVTDTGFSPWFFSVDYRDPEIVSGEIEQVRDTFPGINLWLADIDHDQELIFVPGWYAALKEIALERNGRFVVLTGRSNATHYAAIMDVPVMVLGPSGIAEWETQKDRLNEGRLTKSRVANIACDTWNEVTIKAIADLMSRLS